MYCTCGAPWCDARNLCSADQGASMDRGHLKVRGDGGGSCGPDCEICQERARIPGTRMNWSPGVWLNETTTRVRAVATSQALRMINHNLLETEIGSLGWCTPSMVFEESALDVIYPPS